MLNEQLQNKFPSNFNIYKSIFPCNLIYSLCLQCR